MVGNGETIRSTIYFVRHGECKANLEDKNLPHEIDVLTEKGKLQASLFGKHFHDVVFTRAISSSYSRAHDTAIEILANLDDGSSNKPILKQDPRIREREMGVYENRPMNDLFRDLFAAAKKQIQMLDFEVEGGELVADMDARMSSFLEELLETIKNSKKPETILIVSHGVIMIRMMFKLRAWSKDPSRCISLNSFDAKKLGSPMKNTAYHQLTVDVPKDGNGTTIIDIVKNHQVEHLESLISDGKKPSEEYLKIVADYKAVCDEQCVTH